MEKDNKSFETGGLENVLLRSRFAKGNARSI